MPVNLTIPAPRSLNIGLFQGQPVPISREWLKYLADDLPRILGGIGTISTLPEVVQVANEAQAAAQEALDFGRAARAVADLALSQRFDIRAGSNVAVTRDAQGYVISSTGGSGSPDDASTILAGRVFGG